MSKAIRPGPKAARVVSQAVQATGHLSHDDPEALRQHPTPELHKLAVHCHNDACNLRAIIRELSAVIGEVPPNGERQSVDLKIVIGQLSFLVGESLGPSMEALEQFRERLNGYLNLEDLKDDL